MKKILAILFSLIVLTLILILGRGLYLELPKIEKATADFLINEVKKQISTPEPIRAAKESPSSFLTKAGVLKWTNIQRNENGSLPALKDNLELDNIAELRLKDMFAKQYFAHYSPTGIGASQLADKTGYEYIAIGENIALGNFENDKVLVQAWMDSPGHRANILNTHYTEIGIAVGKGTFAASNGGEPRQEREGEQTWIAVQVFGLPLSTCPQPDATLKARIEYLKSQIGQLENQAEAVKNELENVRPRGREGRTAYNQKVDEYNALVNQINNLAAEAKMIISQYNSQVGILNECIASAQ
jgi:uncharacterized protein YkwD